MTWANAGGPPSIFRIDLPCEQAGFGRPPFDVHLKVLPAPAGGGAWTMLARSSAGKAEVLARWLADQLRVEDLSVAPGLAPSAFRATLPRLPPIWSTAASYVRVHHLDLGADGLAAWFVECTRGQALVLTEHLEQAAGPGPRPPRSRVRCRRALADWSAARISRRQMEALCTAVALGYYEIPHRIDLRGLASATGVSLGSVSELLRRAESAILTHYVDTALMEGAPAQEDGRTLPQAAVRRHEGGAAAGEDAATHMFAWLPP